MSLAQPITVPASLADLRQRVAAIERRPAALHGEVERSRWLLGVGPVDQGLPAAGLDPHGLHEIAGQQEGDTVAAMGFALALAARCGPGGKSTLLWAATAGQEREWGGLYAPGLHYLNAAPEHVVVAHGRNDADVLWSMEEGVRSRALRLVIGIVDAVDMLEARRLSLAAAQAETPVMLLVRHPAASSAAQSRWRIGAVAGAPDRLDPQAPGLARWRVELARCRNGRPGNWTLDWNHAAHSFHLAAALADRSAAADIGWRAAG